MNRFSLGLAKLPFHDSFLQSRKKGNLTDLPQTAKNLNLGMQILGA